MELKYEEPNNTGDTITPKQFFKENNFMEQQELINKIKTLLPQKKEILSRKKIFETYPDKTKLQVVKQRNFVNGYNQALQDTYKALPDIINYIETTYNLKVVEILHKYAMETKDTKTLDVIENIQKEVLLLTIK